MPDETEVKDALRALSLAAAERAHRLLEDGNGVGARNAAEIAYIAASAGGMDNVGPALAVPRIPPAPGQVAR